MHCQYGKAGYIGGRNITDLQILDVPLGGGTGEMKQVGGILPITGLLIFHLLRLWHPALFICEQ